MPTFSPRRCCSAGCGAISRHMEGWGQVSAGFMRWACPEHKGEWAAYDQAERDRMAIVGPAFDAALLAAEQMIEAALTAAYSATCRAALSVLPRRQRWEFAVGRTLAALGGCAIPDLPLSKPDSSSEGEVHVRGRSGAAALRLKAILCLLPQPVHHHRATCDGVLDVQEAGGG